jgi:PIN domain nuclease of toxin-antitoxin system
MILLDTNALIWLEGGHARIRRLARSVRRLYISPANLLEIQLLLEAGRIRLRPGGSIVRIAQDERWVLDDPPAA